MLQLMRKHHKLAMIIVAIIVCITMVYFGQFSRDQNPGYHVSIAGKSYDEVDIKTAANIAGMTQAATKPMYAGPQMFIPGSDAPGRLYSLVRDSQGSSRRGDGGAKVESPLVTLITLREEARNLGVAVSDEDVQKGVQALPQLQTDGKFDREKFDKAAPNETAQRYFFMMMKDALVLDKLQKLIGGDLAATQYTTNLEYLTTHAKTTVQTIVVPRKDVESIKATDEDAQKYYDANKEKDKDPAKNLNLLDKVLKSEPSRTLSYVKFTKVKRDAPEDTSKLPADQQEAKRKEQEEKTKGYEAEDKKMQLTAIAINTAMVNDVAPMKLAEAVASLKDKPEYVTCEIKTAENVIASALPDDLKDAPPLQVEDMLEGDQTQGVIKTPAGGYVIYEGTDSKPSRLLTLEEAKPKLLEKLSKEQVAAALRDKTTGIRSKLQEALSAGKTFAEALTAAEVTATSYTYSQKTPVKDAPKYFQKVQEAVANLETGALAANPVEADDDLALVYLEKVELPQDPKMEDDKKLLKKSAGYSANPYGGASPIFNAWFNQRREAAAPTFAPAP